MTESNIATKLFEIRKKVGTVTKNATASGGKFSWDYVDMATLQELLDPYWEEYSILPTFSIEGDLVVVRLTDIESSTYFESKAQIIISEDFQSTGKQVTYLQRYQLLGLLGKQAVKDTDGGDDPRCGAQATTFARKTTFKRAK